MQKTIYQRVSVLILGMLLLATNVIADEYSYKTHNPRTRRIKNEYHLKVAHLDNGQKKFTRKFTSKKYNKDEEFVLDEDFQTVEWMTKRTDQETDYTGSKDGRKLMLKGVLKGESINKTIELEDDNPFYFTPKFNLQKFIMSDDEKIEFWMLRKDKLTPAPMQATKVGVKKITVDGKEVEAVKVKYSAAGKYAKYYRRTYYYRKSDGVFIKRKAPDGSVTELIEKDQSTP